MTRFELATPATRTQCATRLRYIPKIFNFVPNLAVCQVRYPSRKNLPLATFFCLGFAPRSQNFAFCGFATFRSICSLSGLHFVSSVRKSARQSATSRKARFKNWDGRTRTSECLDQNQVPYHLATSQCHYAYSTL